MLQYQSLSERKKTLNCRGRLIDLSGGKVMGILNITPDSFYDGGNFTEPDAQLRQAELMLKAGATFIDIGGYSTRPGADEISVGEELRRVVPSVKAIIQHFPELILSVDTFRSEVAEAALSLGAHMINDISAGMADAKMLNTILKAKAAYVMMHMQGTPKTMQVDPIYKDVSLEVLSFLQEKANEAHAAGLIDIILDPGFGFGKTVAHNYELLNKLHLFSMLQQPLLIGVSRKSMINKVLHTKPENALNGTSVLNTIAVLQGADILRVHDVKEAVQVLQLVQILNNNITQK